MSEQNNSVPCIAESVEADFERGTWTFEPVGNFVVGAGRYVILPEAQFVQQRAAPDLLEALKLLLSLSGSDGAHSVTLERFNFAKANARSAIAKATGSVV